MGTASKAEETNVERESASVGSTLGHFHLLYLLGEGGMGAVYAARDLEAQFIRLVALKTTKRVGTEAEKLLQDEARIASQIDHQNVCRVHEYDKQGAVQYLVLDYCDGASLHELLSSKPDRKLALPIAVRLIAHVAAGLHAAHELRGSRGQLLEVVHRDVSPHNILISSKGQVSLTDFGVAKSLGQIHRPTETGEVKGKASYMAPEQIRSQDLDRRVDIFALACVLYQSLLGIQPFAGESAVSTMYRILEEELTPPSSLDPDFPGSLELILLRALQKDRELRFETAEEFQIALETWLVEHGYLITESEIESALMDALGPKIQRRKAEVLRLARLDHGKATQVTERESLITNTSRTQEADSTPPATASAEGGRPAGRSPRLLAALGVAVGGALIAGTWVSTHSSAGTQPTASTETAPAKVPSEGKSPISAAQPTDVPLTPGTQDVTGSSTQVDTKDQLEKVTISIRVHPAEALISIDGEERGKGTFDEDVTPSAELRRISARLVGYLPTERVVDFSKDRLIALDLKRAAPSSSPRRATTLGNEVPRKPHINTTPTPAVSRRWSGRTLDQENPFDD